VTEVLEANTSQRCFRCCKIGNRQEGTFKCSNCGLETDSDKNGAHNIAKQGIGKYNETSSDTNGFVTTPEATTEEGTSVQQVSEVGDNLC